MDSLGVMLNSHPNTYCDKRTANQSQYGRYDKQSPNKPPPLHLFTGMLEGVIDIGVMKEKGDRGKKSADKKA